MTKSTKRAYNQWLRLAESKASSSSRIKRDSFLTLGLSCQQAVIEQLNFSQYRNNYNALLDLFNITIGDSSGKCTDPAVLSSSQQRVLFLERFMEAFLDKLCGGSSSNHSAEFLPALSTSINNLPDTY